MAKIEPKPWTQVYPQGTKEGDEEKRVFITLSRNEKYEWRSTDGIAKESKLSPSRVEQIINKYFKLGLIMQNPKNEDQWGYWERHKNLLPSKPTSVATQDKKDRINKVKN